MINKQAKQVTIHDIIPLSEYSKNRKKIRKEIIEFKKNRRVALGPYATFYFECYQTMLAQIQEMLFIEKGGKEQFKDELKAYNPLIPQGRELVATLMFEIDDPFSRADFLNKVGGIEEKVFIRIDSEKINSIPILMNTFSSMPPTLFKKSALLKGSSISNINVATNSLPWGIKGLYAFNSSLNCSFPPFSIKSIS
jgi:hypothetical protein